MIGTKDLFGREAEFAALRELLEVPERLPAVATIAGPAGIGKTALWLAAIQVAESNGYVVLSSRPAEAEARFSFVGLRDLIGGVFASVSARLPGPQRQALETALALSDPYGQAADEGVIALGFLNTLRALVAENGVLIAIDDVQWLDAPSRSMLQFALSRFADEPIAAIFTARDEPPTWLRRNLPEGRHHAVELGPLSVGALHELLRTRLGASQPRPTLIRIWETSGGNAFFALELASALQRRGGRVDPGEELPIPATLDELVDERLDRLSGSALEVAQVVAELADPTVSVVAATIGRRTEAGLSRAVQAKILELDGDRVRFVHPLLGSAVASRSSPARRRELHARLSALVADREEQARHLALATPDPSREVAAIVEEAATGVHARGAAASAAELGELAIRLTPPEDLDNLWRRIVSCADRHVEAGDGQRAMALLQDAYDGAPPGPTRAGLLARRADVVQTFVGPHKAVPLYREALAESGADDALAARIHLNLADCLRLIEDRDQAVAEAELAIQTASLAGDDWLRCQAIGMYGQISFSLGMGIPHEAMNEALALERSMPDWAISAPATRSLAHQLVWSGDLGRARPLIEEWRNELAGRRHHEETRALWFLSVLEFRAGNWLAAARHADHHLALREQFGREGGQPISAFPGAVIAAHRGLLEDARERSQAALALANQDGIRTAQSGHLWVLGLIELSRGDPAAALEYLEPSWEIRDRIRLLEPGQQLEMGDLVEALVAVGRVDDAERRIRPCEELSVRLDRSWGLAIAARSRALILAARGDLVGALASFDKALAEHARTQDPYQHARTLLALGIVQRRAKQRAAARVALDEARAMFEQLGAPLWAEKARDALRRIGGRVRAIDELTEGERQIASLVAEGRTNRDVAATLFVTEHTVEAALTRVYRKLEIRSRAELAARLARGSVGTDQGTL